MKAHRCRTLLATVVAIGTLTSGRSFAQTCAPFPAGVVPFGVLHYISATQRRG